MLLVVFCVSAAQQITGIEALMYYTPQMLEDSGFKNRTEALGINFAMGALKTAVVYVASKALDRDWAGRRPMLMLGFFGMLISNAILAVGFSIGSVPALNVTGLFLFVVFLTSRPRFGEDFFLHVCFRLRVIVVS